MKNTVTLLLVFSLSLCACGSRNATSIDMLSEEHIITWQEQYDLGVRYLSEGNYQEAIIAFTAAIEIDAKQAPAYVGRGDAYGGVAQMSMTNVGEDVVLTEDAANAYNNAVADYLKAIDLVESAAELYKKAAEVYVLLGDAEAAVEILERGIAVTGNESLSEYLEQLNNEIAKEQLRPLYELFEMGDIEGAKVLMRQKEYCDMSAKLSDGFFRYDAGNGVVLAVYPENFYYFGQWQNGQRSGHGMWIRAVFDDDSAMESYIYDGSWENDSPNGLGNITQENDATKLVDRSAILTEISGSFSNGLFDGAIIEVLHVNVGNTYVSSTINAINGIFQPLENLPPETQENEYYQKMIAEGKYYCAFELAEGEEHDGGFFIDDGSIHKVWGF